MITPELRAIVESRAAEEKRELEAKAAAAHADAKNSLRTNAIISMIDQAAPFLDAGSVDETSWQPSAALKIGYCVIATGDLAGAELRAERFVARMLARARELYRAGFFANPFTKEPAMRENA